MGTVKNKIQQKRNLCTPKNSSEIYAKREIDYLICEYPMIPM